MKKNINIGTIIALMFAVLCSCGGNSKGKQQVEVSSNTTIDVEYKVLENYFPRNDIYEGTVMTVVASKEDFDKYLGMAKTMTNNIVTPDFSKDVVLIVCLPATNKLTKLSVVDVKKTNGAVVVNVSQEVEDEERSYTMRPSQVLMFPAEDLKSVEFKINGGESRKIEM
ncbi:MAG: hypothetical protein ACK5MG_03865 [Bacteroidales bacterium]